MADKPIEKPDAPAAPAPAPVLVPVAAGEAPPPATKPDGGELSAKDSEDPKAETDGAVASKGTPASSPRRRRASASLLAPEARGCLAPSRRALCRAPSWPARQRRGCVAA